jgi:hypothetical protein
MVDTFIPLVPTPNAVRANNPASSAFTPTLPASPPPGPEPCSKPVVTLQRQGEIVSGIRIQCGCGQVVDLACVY